MIKNIQKTNLGAQCVMQKLSTAIEALQKSLFMVLLESFVR